MENNLKIATPISHLFENDNFSSQIIDLSDCLECRDHSLDKGFKKQELFHCDLQVIHKFLTDDFNYLKANKILLLDECMASLDVDNRAKCLRAIKKYANDKIVVNICHETIEGFYDEIIYY